MLEIELLSRAHDRNGFDCGSEPLNVYIRQMARQHMDRGISRTFVLIETATPEPKPILGFFTLNLCQVRSERLPRELVRRLPRDASGIKIGRLAVAMGRQRQGLGRVLLVAAMRKAIEVFESVGGIGLFVDAKDDAARAYYEQFGFVSLPDDRLQHFLPMTIGEALSAL